MVATAVFEDDHVAVLVRFCVELSLNDPVAVNCWVPPVWIEGAVGLNEIELKVAVDPPPPPREELELPLHAASAAIKAKTNNSDRRQITISHHNGWRWDEIAIEPCTHRLPP
jgi:hypothetical protein